MFVEGLLPTQTFAVAGSKSLAWMSLKVCSFWNKIAKQLGILTVGTKRKEWTDELLGETLRVGNAM